MDIPKRGAVICQGSEFECGHLNSIIINPKTKETTHLVVEEDYIPHHERVVPIELVKKTTAKAIYLSCTKHEFFELDDFMEHLYFPVEKSYGIFPVKQITYIPYSSTNQKFTDVTRMRIPPGEINFPLESLEVRATDGKIGNVSELLIDDKTEKITHVITSSGHLLAKKELAIPASKIKDIGSSVINLKIRKDEAEKLTRLSNLRH